MDRRERYSDHIEAARTAQDGHQAQIWTALPGIVDSFNAGAVTVSVQPAIKGEVRDKDGKTSHVNLPLLVDVPVVFPRGGGFTMTFPIAKGDECLVVFASRCIDGWWQEGGTQPALDQRMHDLSDAFALIGPMSQKHKIGGVSTGACQLRSDDAATVVELAAGHVTVKAAVVTIDTPSAVFTGKITAAGEITSATIGLQAHHHGDPQGGSTTPSQP